MYEIGGKVRTEHIRGNNQMRGGFASSISKPISSSITMKTKFVVFHGISCKLLHGDFDLQCQLRV